MNLVRIFAIVAIAAAQICFAEKQRKETMPTPAYYPYDSVAEEPRLKTRPTENAGGGWRRIGETAQNGANESRRAEEGAERETRSADQNPESRANAARKPLPPDYRFNDWRQQILDKCPDLDCTPDEFQKILDRACKDGRCDNKSVFIPAPGYAHGCDAGTVFAHPNVLRGKSFWRSSIEVRSTNFSSEESAMIENPRWGPIVQGLCPGGSFTMTFSTDWLGKDTRVVVLRARPWDPRTNRPTNASRMRINGPCFSYDMGKRQEYFWDFSFDNVPPDFSGPEYGPGDADRDRRMRDYGYDPRYSYDPRYGNARTPGYTHGVDPRAYGPTVAVPRGYRPDGTYDPGIDYNPGWGIYSSPTTTITPVPIGGPVGPPFYANHPGYYGYGRGSVGIQVQAGFHYYNWGNRYSNYSFCYAGY